MKRLQQAWYQSSSLRLRWFKWQIVTNSMYANWYVEYEFITKNQFHNWTSQLVCIWHIFRKLGYFWLFLRAPVQATSGDKNKTLVLEPSKRAKNNPISKKCAKCVLALMSNYEIDFWWWIYILHFKLYEICLHCHWLGFSSFILNFGPLTWSHNNWLRLLRW